MLSETGCTCLVPYMVQNSHTWYVYPYDQNPVFRRVRLVPSDQLNQVARLSEQVVPDE